jgi:hypothetical protein
MQRGIEHMIDNLNQYLLNNIDLDIQANILHLEELKYELYYFATNRNNSGKTMN